MVKRFVVILFALLVAGTGVASAGDGYADDDTITVSCPSPSVGDTCTITASFFEPGSTVTVTLFSGSTAVVLGSGVADDSGTATFTVTIPNVPPGAYTVEAEGTGVDGEPLTVSTSLTVAGAGAGPGAGPGAGGGAGLPRTGSDSTSLGQVAIAAIAGGGLLLLIANKRRATQSKINVDA